MEFLSGMVNALAAMVGIVADTYFLLLLIAGVVCMLNPGARLNPFLARVSDSAVNLIARATKRQVERSRAITVALIGLLFLRVVIVAVLRDLAGLIK